jgi:hypothetical protein
MSVSPENLERLSRKIIYRVEHKESRKGLYRSSDYAQCELHERTRHPMPYNDSLLNNFWGDLDEDFELEHFYFGFTSIEQLKFWIHNDEDRTAIDKEGLVVSVFWAEVYAGDTQCVYLKSSRGETISKHRLTEI